MEIERHFGCLKRRNQLAVMSRILPLLVGLENATVHILQKLGQFRAIGFSWRRRVGTSDFVAQDDSPRTAVDEDVGTRRVSMKYLRRWGDEFLLLHELGGALRAFGKFVGETENSRQLPQADLVRPSKWSNSPTSLSVSAEPSWAVPVWACVARTTSDFSWCAARPGRISSKISATRLMMILSTQHVGRVVKKNQHAETIHFDAA